MAHHFGMEIARESDSAVLWIRGEIDLSHRDEIADTAIALLSDEKVVIADLSEVGFIDSAGLSALVKVRREAGRLGREFRVRSASGPVASLLRVTGLAEWLHGEPS